jgi:hypothetical protein
MKNDKSNKIYYPDSVNDLKHYLSVISFFAIISFIIHFVRRTNDFPASNWTVEILLMFCLAIYLFFQKSTLEVSFDHDNQKLSIIQQKYFFKKNIYIFHFSEITMSYEKISTKRKEGDCSLKIFQNGRKKINITFSKDNFSKENLLEIYSELYILKE